MVRLAINLNGTASYSVFEIPSVPVSTLAAKLPAAAQPPVIITLTANVAGLFPLGTIPTGVGSHQLLLGKTELVTYVTDATCGALAANQVCVTERGPVKNPPSPKKQHNPGTRVQLATQTTAQIPATVGECTLGTEILPATAITPATPKLITCTGSASMSKAGAVTISHTGTQTPNQITFSPPTPAVQQGSEMFKYNNNLNTGVCTLPLPADRLCLTDRGQQPDHTARYHKANGYPQPCSAGNWGTCPRAGESNVTEHFQIQVKSNEGFFPSKPLIIYDVDVNNQPIEEELFGYDNAATKVKASPLLSTEIHITSRGEGASTFKTDTPVVKHPAGSIVTGSHVQLVCREGLNQPGILPQPTGLDLDNNPTVNGSSVAAYPVCYTQNQPNGPPKLLPSYVYDPTNTEGGPAGTGDLCNDTTDGPDADKLVDQADPQCLDRIDTKKLQVPIIGSTLIVMSGVGVPFLSTGGLLTSLLGPIPYVDANGTTDKTLKLVSPCLLDFTPGVNMQVFITLNVDKTHLTPDSGIIKVVQDTAHDDNEAIPPTPLDDCDDPAGTSPITLNTYVYPWPGLGDPNVDDPKDNDTDGDKCPDARELGPNAVNGGVRDPWNKWDYYDVTGDGKIDLFNDILGVIGTWNTSNAVTDRGNLLYGPFGQNRAERESAAARVDLFNDILGVIGQWNNNCT